MTTPVVDIGIVDIPLPLKTLQAVFVVGYKTRFGQALHVASTNELMVTFMLAHPTTLFTDVSQMLVDYDNLSFKAVA